VGRALCVPPHLSPKKKPRPKVEIDRGGWVGICFTRMFLLFLAYSPSSEHVCGDLGYSRFCPKKPAATRKPTPQRQRTRYEAELTAKPVGIDDGDTFIIQFRSQGIDTPEKRQLCENAAGACYACGQSAKRALLDMIRFKNNRGRWQFKTLRFKVWTTGKYGRPVVTAYDGDRDLHLELLEQGWAVAYRQYLPAPLKGAYLAAEAGAKAAKRGLWQGKFIVPSAWRRGGRLACERR